MEKTDTSRVRTVQRYETSAGAQVYQIPVEEFPVLWGYAYLILYEDPEHGPYRVLIDTGSGFGDSNSHLEAGLRLASEQSGTQIEPSDLTHILITHGHIDHFGGLSYLRPLTSAKIGVHELDLRNLTNYEERLTVVAVRLKEFLAEAGVPVEERDNILQLYTITKSLHHSVRVDFTYEASGMRLGPFEFLHVPGHCAGHVVIRLHDILFSGDHVLARTSPHQSPERLTLSTGLDHYLHSLDAVETWAGMVRLTLGGHEQPITDLPARLEEIRTVHRQRLEELLELFSEAHTILEVSQRLFGEVHGYNVLLALEEAGAHVEYLYQRGLLGIANLEDLESNPGIPLRYRKL